LHPAPPPLSEPDTVQTMGGCGCVSAPVAALAIKEIGIWPSYPLHS
jgi:hypothetical protein